MAGESITVSGYQFYSGTGAAASQVVGWDNGKLRYVRYTIVASSTGAGASHLSIKKGTVGLQAGAAIGLRFFITTDPQFYEQLPTVYASTGLSLTGKNEGGYYTFTGDADVLLLPGKEYYLYIFPGTSTYGSYLWNGPAAITITPSGAAGVIRIKEGDQEVVIIPTVKENGEFITLSATVKDGENFKYFG